MGQKSFNIPQFNSVIDAAIKEYETEEKKINEKKELLDYAKKCVVSLQKKLNEAYQTINSQEHDLSVLEQQLEEEKQQREERARLDEKIQGITEQNTALLEQLANCDDRNKHISQKLVDEKRQREELEMKLVEMRKLLDNVTKKTSEEAMLKALRTYANTSKRKTIDKRIFAKTAILEMANANGLTLPPDLAATIDSLDDDQTEPKTVNVAGNYNDIHDNATVNQKQQ